MEVEWESYSIEGFSQSDHTSATPVPQLQHFFRVLQAFSSLDRGEWKIDEAAASKSLGQGREPRTGLSPAQIYLIQDQPARTLSTWDSCTVDLAKRHLKSRQPVLAKIFTPTWMRPVRQKSSCRRRRQRSTRWAHSLWTWRSSSALGP